MVQLSSLHPLPKLDLLKSVTAQKFGCQHRPYHQLVSFGGGGVLCLRELKAFSDNLNCSLSFLWEMTGLDARKQDRDEGGHEVLSV